MTDFRHKTSFPYEVMFEKRDLLERLDIQVDWGYYRIKVLRIHLISFDRGHVIDFHNHAEYEFHFIPRGKGIVILEDQTFALSEGMFYLTGPGVVHYQAASSEEAMDELCLHVDIVPIERNECDPWEAAEAEECMEKLCNLPRKPEQDRHGAMACFLEAYQVCDGRYSGYYTSIRQLVLTILMKAVRAYDAGVITTEAPIRNMTAYRYQYAVQYMEANSSSSLTLENVAEKLNISARQLQRTFHQMDAQKPFSKLLEDIRLKSVCKRLEETDLSIEQIAQSEGFANATYLHAVFRKKIGMTPAEYRKSKQFKVETI
ncbi:helix-turn-helix domain-containing protein [Paenibacillus brevis]|uniref:AraC family transcriptional regulator n=1 Tax=Paenibacillus brevis TaxID=2841508 RepID=A0ABS6FTU3_9BACL|nr:helix-turn-helix domain-containing protein [Paenibacillus brevis]MBU5672571.1 AraC family transcriptional regulator [Paenibacillus brevis]